MKKLYFLALVVLASFSLNAQYSISLDDVDSQYLTTYSGETVIDVATCNSNETDAAVSMTNPLLADTNFSTVEISFDVYNYLVSDSIKGLGSLVAIVQEDADTTDDGYYTGGRLFFSNGSYLGYNGDGGWYDANMTEYASVYNFIGAKTWKSVKLQFSATGFTVEINDEVSYTQSDSTASIPVTTYGLTDISKQMDLLKTATTLMIGTGSWWSSNTRTGGGFYDLQYSYLKNIVITPDYENTSALENNSTNTNISIYSSNGQLRFNNVEDYASLRVYNLLGKTVFTGTKYDAENFTLDGGIYVVRIASNNETVTKKILITE